ncbi:MAG: tRNA preQ1(34) S-adenosylmethionine ribosyltransferase-isomerase QueA [Planctomycetia bacterium]|nr:tRNA preQ1(34) S-adenosylmethionine ribosyltransferase-isomerase QueA [Planctomycetia bacterium]
MLKTLPALSDYDYELPPELIAQRPLHDRADARLLVVRRERQSLEHMKFRDLPKLLNPNDLLIYNDTKVVNARLMGVRVATGGRWEGLFLRFDAQGCWEVMSKTRGKLTSGELLQLDSPQGPTGRHLEVVGRTPERTLLVRPVLSGRTETAFTLLDEVGFVPIPPYIRSGRMDEQDRGDYQTVYAEKPGAVAAPTAGLHFTDELLAELTNRGIEVARVTLHVGAGTFKPITSENLDEHVMHTEWSCVSEDVVQAVQACHRRGGRVVAVGTTTVRSLESAANQLADGRIDSTGRNDSVLAPFAGVTNLFIRPPYKFKTTDVVITNFHLPKSTLIILVRTFGGDDLMRRAYEEAVRQRYRFYSYGDAMIIL